MKVKIPGFIVIFVFILFFSLLESALCTENPNIYHQIGVRYFKLHDYDKALENFHKSLEDNPYYEETKLYISKINQIRNQEVSHTLNSIGRESVDVAGPSIQQTAIRQKEIKQTTINDPVAETYTQEPLEREQSLPVSVSGQARLALGFNTRGAVWKKANADAVGVPQEKNYRFLFGQDRHNTFDRRIYDQLKLDIETTNPGPLNAYMQVKIDPWTFIAKNNVTVTDLNGTESADIVLKYWSATGMTINEIYRTSSGNILNLNEIGVHDGFTRPYTPTGLSDWGTLYNEIGPVEISRELRPIRKLWFDYVNDDYSLRAFPLAGQEQALTSDDPLRLSNNHMPWEESPWLDEYEPSRVFEDNASLTLKRGIWIRRLSFFARDSELERLTYLRGASFNMPLGATGSLEAVTASPLNWWADYEHSDSIHSAIRLKNAFTDKLTLGTTYTSKIGLADSDIEAQNNVLGVDLNYALPQERSIYAQVAGSNFTVEERKSEVHRDDVAAAYLIGYNRGSTIDPIEGCNWDFYFASLDTKFYPGLTNYRYTRRDQFYSKHLSFEERPPEDAPFRLGNGIDSGWQTLGLKFRRLCFDDTLDTLIDLRRINTIGGKYVETDSRLELTWQANPKLKTKFLGYYQDLPKTTENFDPHIYAKTSYAFSDYYSNDNRYMENADIEDGKEASIGHFGLGAEYDINDQWTIQGMYERTNDPEDMPRILLTDSYVTAILHEGIYLDSVVPFLYDQDIFDLPPYKYYGIMKTKLKFQPAEWIDYALSYTHNDNEYASPIDDNVSHVGFEINFRPSDKLTIWTKYTASRLTDLYLQQSLGEYNKNDWHHNVFLGVKYQLDDVQTLDFLYGEFPGYDSEYSDGTWSLTSLDTRHMFRIFYTRKF